MEDLERVVISPIFITLLEEKLDKYSSILQEIKDANLRNLLDFLFHYVIEKPTTTPWSKTILKQFDLSPKNNTLKDDIRRFLYATRLIMEISKDKQHIERNFIRGI